MERSITLDEEKVPIISDRKKMTLARREFVTGDDGKKVILQPSQFFELSLQECQYCNGHDLSTGRETAVGNCVKTCLSCDRTQHHFVQCIHPFCKKSNLYFWTGFMIPKVDPADFIDLSSFFCSREHQDTQLEVTVSFGENKATISECLLNTTMGMIFETALEGLGVEGDDLKNSYFLVLKGKKCALGHQDILAQYVSLADKLGKELVFPDLEILSIKSTLSKPTKVKLQRRKKKEKKEKKNKATKKRPRKEEAEPYIEGIQHKDKVKWQKKQGVFGPANPEVPPRNQQGTNVLCLYLKPDHFTPEQLLDGTISKEDIFNDGNTLMIILRCPTSVNSEKNKIKKELMESGFPWERIKELALEAKDLSSPSPPSSSPPTPSTTKKTKQQKRRKKEEERRTPEKVYSNFLKYKENVEKDIARKKMQLSGELPVEEEDTDFDKACQSAIDSFPTPLSPSLSSSPYPMPFRSPTIPQATPVTTTTPTTPKGLHFSETDATRAAMKESHLDFKI